jgi:putative FmdB family regulatory protein
MPIYAYKCEVCGHAKDVLQKMSDTPLSVCPQCGAETFKKQLTAAGFQLKGSGWYVTDFRGGNSDKPGDSGEAAVKSADVPAGGPATADPAKPGLPNATAPTPAPASSPTSTASPASPPKAAS